MADPSPRALTPTPFAPEPRLRLRTFALAAAGHLAYGGDSGGPEAEEAEKSPEARFLLNHLELATEERASWREGLAAYLERPAEPDLPLLSLVEPLGLELPEVLATALAAAVEDDVMIGRSLAHLQAPVGGSRPTLGLLAGCLAPAAQADGLQLLAAGAAVESGLLRLLEDGAPLPEKPVAVPSHLCFALNGRDSALEGTTVVGPTQIPLAPSILEEAERHARALVASPGRALILRTASPAEGRAVAAAVATALELRPLLIETEELTALSPWLLVRGLLPVFRLSLGPGERKLLPRLPRYRGPVLALCGPDGGVEMADGSAVSWSLPVPSAGERRELWRESLGAGRATEDLAESLARDHRHTCGRIAQLGRTARHRANVAGRAEPEPGDIAAAAWFGEGAGLDALAQPLPEAVGDDGLVMPQALERDLSALLERCRARDGLVDDLGCAARNRYRPGVRALLIGSSGTGKTLAAGWLASKLALPLYRVDLAAVTSKYIGETEKNLAELLARAEQAEVLLLFDEADSMFGKRTDIKDSNDRFANAQTNYLLQRIETYDGITILTSNSRARFDNAFTRRLDAIVEFPVPGPEERRRLWLAHLGDAHEITAAQINRLAATAALCGGHIRNVVLAAAARARSTARPLVISDLHYGLSSEYRKLGRQLPVEFKERG